MTVLARSGTLSRARSCSPSMNTATSSTAWLSIILLGTFHSIVAHFSLFSDKIVTGSFDKKAKIWDATTGQCYHTLKGHKMEIVCLSFDPHGMLVATGSMDNTAKLWDVETGQEIFTLSGHKAEIVSLHFNTDGDKLLTSSFDNTAKIWDVCTG
jgi:dynein assembly factor with WDR repeat domains 1